MKKLTRCRKVLSDKIQNMIAQSELEQILMECINEVVMACDL